MASDTFSSLLRVRLQATGNNFNDWINKFNNEVVKVLENAIAGQTNVFPLNSSPVQNPTLAFAGFSDGSGFLRCVSVQAGATETVILWSQRTVPSYWVVINLHPTGPVMFSLDGSTGVTLSAGANLVFYDGGPRTAAHLWVLA